MTDRRLCLFGCDTVRGDVQGAALVKAETHDIVIRNVAQRVNCQTRIRSALTVNRTDRTDPSDSDAAVVDALYNRMS